MTEAITANLLDRAKSGDRDAYDTLFALAADRLLLFIRLRLGAALRAKLDSMDVLQEAYLEAHRALPSFELSEDGAFARWLCRISENKIRGLADYHGAKKRQEPQADRHVSDVLAAQTGPVTVAARKEGRIRLEKAIDKMESEEREALLLRYFEDLTVDQIGETMGRSPTSVRRLLGRATVRLGDLLK